MWWEKMGNEKRGEMIKEGRGDDKRRGNEKRG
jgi:hypothetical protein